MDDSQDFSNKLKSAKGRRLQLHNTYHLDRQIRASVDVDLHGDIKLNINHKAYGLEISPPVLTKARSEATKAESRSLKAVGVNWSENAHTGRWVEITDQTINPHSKDPTIQSRQILGNDHSTLYLKTALGYNVPNEAIIEIFEPLDHVRLDGLTIARHGTSGANLIIRYAKSVKLTGLTIQGRNANSGTKRGNALSIYSCGDVSLTDVGIKEADNFGIFIYNCETVNVANTHVEGWGGQFAIQLKDCRYGVVSNSSASSGPGDAGFSLKCSGLNPVSHLRLTKCSVSQPGRAGVELSSLTAEGNVFTASDLSVQEVSVSDCVNGFTQIVDSGAATLGFGRWEISNCSVTNASQYSYVIRADKTLLSDWSSLNSGLGAVLVSANDVQVKNGLASHMWTKPSQAKQSTPVTNRGKRLQTSGNSVQ